MIPKQTSSIVLVTDTVRHCPIVSLGCDRPLGGGPPAARHCAHADIVELQVYCMVELTRKADGPGVYYTASRLVSTAQQVCPPPRHHLHSCLPEMLHTLYSPLCTPLRHSSIVRPKPSIATYLACSTIASLAGV